MNAKNWLPDFETNQGYLKLKAGLEGRKKLNIKGNKGSFLQVLIATFQSENPQKQLIIANDQEEAAYIYNDIQNLLGETKALYYPESAKGAYQTEKTKNANIIQRAEVLTELNNSKKKIIISYPEALLEKVVTKKELQKNSLKIQVGDCLSMEFVIDLLFEYEFNKEQFVIEPGQFAVRGGLIDIWSFSNDKPFRVDFFGDDIDSIRSFDPADQLSISNFNHINIIPNIQEKILQESQTSFLEFLGLDTTVWIKNIQFTLDRIEKAYQKSVDAWSRIEENTTQLPPHKLFVNETEFSKTLNEIKTIEFEANLFYKDSETIAFNTSPQPNFNKNFELLIKDIKSHIKDGYEISIISENAKQIERIHAIFDDFEVKGIQIGNDLKFEPRYFTLHEGFIDHDNKIVCYTDHQIFDRYHRFRLKDSFRKSNQEITMQELTGLQKGDYVTHIDFGIGVFDGMEAVEQGGKKTESIRLIYKDKDVLYVNIQSLHRIAKYSGKEGKEPKLNKLGTTTWKVKKASTKKKIKQIAYDLIKVYAKRKAAKGFEYSPDSYLQNELEASFMFEDTPDQVTTTTAVKQDMEKAFPMDRLVCGDVGFGKTEIAIRAAFKAATDGKQVAILVPTTILALQHFKTFAQRLKDFPVTVDYINRFRTPKQTKEILENLETGKIDILIGTHRLVGKDIKYKDLGLFIIDEEQKFGVSVKDKIKSIKANIDTLTLTATPIPRTLQFSLLGARDLSVINTPPPNRHPVETNITGFNEEVIRDALVYELSRGGQVFFIHNRVENIKEVAGVLNRLVPDAKVCVGHGQMDGKQLEKVMMDFMHGDYDVLVATTIIESGLDIPNANTIFINQAQNFGLSDLHQMRGRVGRSNKKAFCYLLAPPLSSLNDESRKRLRAIEEFSDLGSGFNISMRDLDIRGAGDLLGAEQSGFISDIGYDTYQKILDETIQELKEGEFKELYADEFKEEHKTFVKDCSIETDIEILIPTFYVNAVDERLKLYKRLNDLKNEEELLIYVNNLIDRFGDLPEATQELINTMRLKWIAQDIGLEKLYLKNGSLRGYFVTNPQSEYYQSDKFGKILIYVQQNMKTCKMKEVKGKLTISYQNVRSINQAKATLLKLSDVIHISQ